ncbi:Endopeptidase La [Bertholletia excelsa]
MQVSNMQALRTLYACKHLRKPATQSSFSLSTFVSGKSPQNPKFSRHFHSTNQNECQIGAGLEALAGDVANSDSDNQINHVVDTAYDPLSGRLVTRKIKPNGSVQEPELSGVSSFNHEDASRDRRYGAASGDHLVNRKKGKSRTVWVCSNCGNTEGQWWGSCRHCNSVGTITRFSEGKHDQQRATGFQISENVVRSWLPKHSADAGPVRLTEVNRGFNQMEWRIPLSGLFGTEVARVLGGGLVPGSLVLVGGDPGVGKSTLLLQIAAIIAEGHVYGEPAPVVYISGEESVEQIGNRADRMGIEAEQLFLYSSTDIEDILEKTQVLSPRALVIDSIQTVYLSGVTGSAGGIYQVKECTSALLRFAKKTNIPVLLIGHVTKSGDIAGPRVLEHIVDVVLYMEGEKHSSHRLLRSVKNRFGATDELGVFEMSQGGLQAVSNPSEIFLSEQQADSEFLAGLAVAVIMDGSRTFLIEIQALCVPDSSRSRQVNGIHASRADMIISVLKKQAGLKLQDNDIFLNVVSGVTLAETAGDLAVAAAICSSFLEFPIPSSVAFIGEIGLGGELRPVPRMEKRVNTVAKLGYKSCIVPKSSVQPLVNLGVEGTTIIGCSNLKDMINTVFKT